jgi:hypothetical protein
MELQQLASEALAPAAHRDFLLHRLCDLLIGRVLARARHPFLGHPLSALILLRDEATLPATC